MKKEDRVVLNNIVLDMGKKYLIMNLINFRREYVNKEQLKIMRSIDVKRLSKEKLQDEEEVFYKELLAKKQVLTEEMISMYEEKRKKMELANLETQPCIKSIAINMSYKCNFNCDYCYQKGFIINEKITEKKVDFLYSFLEDYARKVNKPFRLDGITISGGEPLLDENISIIKYIMRKFEDICDEFILYTNGTLLARQMSEIDFEKVSSLQISIDGNDEVMRKLNHNQQGNLFNDILKSIDILKREKKRKISIPILLCDVVVENFENLVREFEKHDLLSAENVGIFILPDWNFGEGNKRQCLYKNEEEYVCLNTRIKEMIQDKNIQLGYPRSISAFYKALVRPTDKQWKGKVVSCATRDTIPVTFGPEGNVYWCTCVVQHDGIIGEYYPKSFVNEVKIKEYHMKTIYDQIGCRQCEFRYVCGGGCRLNMITNNTLPACGLWDNVYFLENMEKFF